MKTHQTLSSKHNLNKSSSVTQLNEDNVTLCADVGDPSSDFDQLIFVLGDLRQLNLLIKEKYERRVSFPYIQSKGFSERKDKGRSWAYKRMISFGSDQGVVLLCLLFGFGFAAGSSGIFAFAFALGLVVVFGSARAENVADLLVQNSRNFGKAPLELGY